MTRRRYDPQRGSGGGGGWLGSLVALGIVGGIGYYAYKKGWLNGILSSVQSYLQGGTNTTPTGINPIFLRVVNPSATPPPLLGVSGGVPVYQGLPGYFSGTGAPAVIRAPIFPGIYQPPPGSPSGAQPFYVSPYSASHGGPIAY